MDRTERTMFLHIAHAAQALLERLDTLYTDTFAVRGERVEREALRAALAGTTLTELYPDAAVCAALQTYYTAHGVPDEARLQVAVPGDDLWDDWRTAPRMLGDPDTAVVALRSPRYAGYGGYYASAEGAIANIEGYFYVVDPPSSTEEAS
jgi:hypothetical protein